MTDFLGWTAAEIRIFDAVCRRVRSRGNGILTKEVSAAGALARELCQDEPDQRRVEALVEALTLTEDDVDSLTREAT